MGQAPEPEQDEKTKALDNLAEYLYNNFSLKEGKMTKMRANYVCENALYEYASILKINDYIKLGKGEQVHDGYHNKTIVADVFEAFIGAIYLDGGFASAKEFIHKFILNDLEHKKLFYDSKTILQEMVQGNIEGKIKYKLVNEDGQEYVQTSKKSLDYVIIDEYGPAHDKTFEVVVKIDDIIYGKGKAHSKKEAEQIAAKDALSKAKKILI